MTGLYIHIPFCLQKCSYCDFLSFPAGEELQNKYLQALNKELGMLPQIKEGLDTIFIGGGTPSLLPDGAIEKILERVAQNQKLKKGCEITIESNPGTFGKEKLREYLQAGCNRISIGVQSLDDGLLRAIGRIHNSEQAKNAALAAREAGFKNINLDLMYGLPGQSLPQHENSLRQAVGLCDHISVYSLILEEGTPLERQVQRGEIQLPGEEEEYRMHRRTIEILGEAGFEQYEVSNFCKGGHDCRHNLNYWKCGEYLAAGLGASSALKEGEELVRRRNSLKMTEYFAAIEAGKLPWREEERLKPRELAFELIMLGLRMNAGICEEEFFRRTGQQLRQRYPRSLAKGIREGFLTLEQGRLRMTERGMEVQNSVLVEFMEEDEEGEKE
jgi:oxygen-independent coproporphyrinogen-3 oxidase